jgi:hypothetical protein
MAQHNVKFTVPERPVGNADIIFTVFENQEKFGKLRISKGNIVWYPGKKVYGYALSWSKLDELAREHGRQG